MALPSRRSIVKGGAAALAAAAFSRSPGSFAAAATEPVEHRVRIARLKFVPEKLQVRVGDTITWANEDIAPHTATALDRSWDTGRINKNETKTITVVADLSSAYFCKFHPTMKAHLVITVTG